MRHWHVTAFLAATFFAGTTPEATEPNVLHPEPGLWTDLPRGHDPGAWVDVDFAFPDGFAGIASPGSSLWVDGNGSVRFGGAQVGYLRAAPNRGALVAALWWDDLVPAGSASRVSIRVREQAVDVRWLGYSPFGRPLGGVLDGTLTLSGSGDVDLQLEHCPNRVSASVERSEGSGAAPRLGWYAEGSGEQLDPLEGRGCTGTNVDEPGHWRFSVGGPAAPVTTTVLRETTPWYRRHPQGRAPAPPAPTPRASLPWLSSAPPPLSVRNAVHEPTRRTPSPTAALRAPASGLRWWSVLDADGDALFGQADCDDANPAIGGPFTYYADPDGDGSGDGDSTAETCATQAPAGYVDHVGPPFDPAAPPRGADVGESGDR